jgi:hypothetical protein
LTFLLPRRREGIIPALENPARLAIKTSSVIVFR